MLTLLCGFVSANAQCDEKADYMAAPSRNEYLLKDPIWTLSIGAGAQAYFGEDDGKAKFNKRLTFAPTISISRRMGNILGLRLQLTGGTLHGYNDGDSGYYTRWTSERYYSPSDATFDPQWNYMGWVEGVDYRRISVPGYDGSVQTGWTSLHKDQIYLQTMHYIGLYGDLSFNLLNMLEGYKPHRVVDINPFIGVGVLQRFAHRGTLVGTFVAPSLGVDFSYNFMKNFSAYTSLRGALVPDAFDGQVAELDSKFATDGVASWTFGVSYKFGEPKYIDPAIDRRLAMPYNIAKAKDGMVLIPGGNIEMGAGVDQVWGDSIPKKLVAVSPFWMDETEVTNAQYREFVYWVRDSIIRERLADPAYGGDVTYKVLVKDGYSGQLRLNWQKEIPWKNPTEREASAIASVIGGNPFAADQSGLNFSILKYKYEWFDAKSYYSSLAKLSENNAAAITISKDTAYIKPNGDIVRETITRISHGDPADFTNTYIVSVYPDVFTWMTDFANAKNEQYVKNYFTKAAFDNFPVVGVSWEQADAYCAWRTAMANAKKKPSEFEAYRLPTEAEWEFAARNGRSELMYPWYSEKTHTTRGLANSNFRESRDLKDLVSPVATFLPNRFGLYDMAGNVSEWTTTTYTESTDVMADLVNPDYSYRAVNSDPDILKRKVIKGGSWKDTSDGIRADMRSFEKQGKSRSYVGFRCVRSWGVDSKGNLN